jgi:hypothetical protein
MPTSATLTTNEREPGMIFLLVEESFDKPYVFRRWYRTEEKEAGIEATPNSDGSWLLASGRTIYPSTIAFVEQRKIKKPKTLRPCRWRDGHWQVLCKKGWVTRCITTSE